VDSFPKEPPFLFASLSCVFAENYTAIFELPEIATVRVKPGEYCRITTTVTKIVDRAYLKSQTS
jgi:hypothetical protein